MLIFNAIVEPLRARNLKCVVISQVAKHVNSMAKHKVWWSYQKRPKRSQEGFIFMTLFVFLSILRSQILAPPKTHFCLVVSVRKHEIVISKPFCHVRTQNLTILRISSGMDFEGRCAPYKPRGYPAGPSENVSFSKSLLTTDAPFWPHVEPPLGTWFSIEDVRLF